MERKHSIYAPLEKTQNSVPLAHFSVQPTQFDVPLAQFSVPSTQFSVPSTQFSNDIENTIETDTINNDNTSTISNTVSKRMIECPECNKQFTRMWCLERHIEKCKGNINKHKCEYCNKLFSYKTSRYHHYKVCKIKKEKDATTLVPTNPTSTEVVENTSDQCAKITNNNTINNGTIENQQVNNTQNIQNNNNNVIIVYDPNNINFKTDHLAAEDLHNIVQLASRFIDSRVVTEYSKKIFANPENICVRKEDMKTGHSEVYKGEGSWDLELDRNVYPTLANNMANNMSEFLSTKRDVLRKELFDRLTRFVDYMADEGYINTDDVQRQKEIQREYKTFVQGLKLIVFGKTKKTYKKKEKTPSES
jgi:hypothetical protein